MSSKDTVEPDRERDPEPDDGERIRQLEEALASHAVVDQARGILMALHRMDADAAWGLLVRVSSHENIKVRTLAEAIIELVSSPVPAPVDAATTAALRYLLPRNWDEQSPR